MTTRYVSITGDDTNDGSTWELAKLTIQAGINAAISADTVWVRAGTYVENITIGASITVRSETGLPADVTIDGNAVGTVVTMASSSWLIGFTVTNGSGTDGGGVYNGSAYNCIVSNNVASRSGGGGSYCTFYNCTIFGNNGGSYGGGICDGTGYNCLIKQNETTGLLYYGGGGGVYHSTIYNCTVVDNTTVQTGGGIFGSTVINCISYDNDKVDDIFKYTGSEEYSCGPAYSGLNSIDSDLHPPLFFNSSIGNYRLSGSSPCIDTGFNYSWMADEGDLRSEDLDNNARIYNLIVDMGAYEYGSDPYSSSSSSFLSSSSFSLSSWCRYKTILVPTSFSSVSSIVYDEIGRAHV